MAVFAAVLWLLCSIIYVVATLYNYLHEEMDDDEDNDFTGTLPRTLKTKKSETTQADPSETVIHQDNQSSDDEVIQTIVEV